MIPDPTRAPSGSQESPPDLVSVRRGATVPVRGALCATWPACPSTWVGLTCDLPAGHHSPEHYDREQRTVWLHPDTPLPEPRPLPPIPLETTA